MNLEEILLKEPRLISVMAEVFTVKNTPLSTHEKDRYWYQILKPRMMRLVGFNCDNPELSTSEVYDKVYQFLINLMDI